ncbi:MAG: radical SAM protein [Myxococcales bacterium]|nr:radical SAM protein [Myxococcales bacterium]
MRSGWSFEAMDSFVAATRTAVFVRRADSVLFIRPEKTLGLNGTAALILEALYNREGRRSAEVLGALATRLGVGLDRLCLDCSELLEAVRALMQGDFTPRPTLRFGGFERSRIRFPTLAEIALTYDCQNRCTFCYAASPHRSADRPLMTTAQVVRVMEKIFHQAHVPSLSFTGGEATLRPDLAELVGQGKRIGFRMNLITNGVRAGNDRYAGTLVEAGLDSAQVSLEAAQAELHDSMVGRRGAFARTVLAVKNFKALGIHVHTNTTLSSRNVEAAPELIRFAGGELGLRTLSMNLLIPTGSGLDAAAGPLSYSALAERLPSLAEVAKEEGVKLVWYSPLPYCILNPVVEGFGAKACACIDGLLSVDPAGSVLPCSSFADGIGSLLESSFEEIYSSKAARYWREKRYVPPPCKSCGDVDLCAGACPLYWDAAKGFEELPVAGAADRVERRRWEQGRADGGSFGVRLPAGG